ncbi:MAG: TRAP transporter small permease [Desulfovibrio sp.]|jgi:TRAP-type C4-dicarboxylate transport system permease small subunit|nr:TRAP transporter small permease [Desulfovibrio sp.]
MTHDAPPSVQNSGPTRGEFAFQVFCAVLFLGMIGLVTYNAFLRYAFRSAFAPSEEWARFLFIFVTFFGSIEAFYRGKHIAVDMFVGLLNGASRKTVDVVASLLGLGCLVLLLWGGIVLVLQNIDTWSVATNVNMAVIYGVLPIMAAAALVIRGREFLLLLAKPASEFTRVVIDPKKIAEEAKEDF